MAPSRDPLIGAVINGKFLVERALARGGMGRIYFGKQAPLARPVALKIVKADSINENESQFLRRFLLEASILAKLQHPNVVTLFDYGRIEGTSVEMYFIAMEFLDGETLAKRLRTRGSLAACEALILFRQIARGLREAHSRGIVHRDLKPSNIVIVPDADGEIVKLVDFGIGKVERSDEDLTGAGVVVGTPKYMAPEQFGGLCSPASDVYALGVILYQCFTGALPFPGNTLAELMVAKMQYAIPAIHDVNPVSDVTPSIEALVYWMLARAPEARPTLDDIFAELAVCEEEIFGASGARFALGSSGLRPGLGFRSSSRPHAIGCIEAPDTIVTHTSTDGTGAPFAAASESPRPLAGITPRPTATTARPPPIGASWTFPVVVVVALVFSVGSVAAAALWFAKTRFMGEPASTTVTTNATASASTTAPAPTFVLHIQSTPNGATVSEDGTVLGSTPLRVVVDRAGAARKPRTFLLQRDGYIEASITQGPAQGDVDQMVSLAPDPTYTVGSAAPPPSGAKPAGSGKTTPPSRLPGVDDIRLRR